MTPREIILQQVLALPVQDQAFVARAIEGHLVAKLFPETEEAPELDGDEFLAELQRRSASYRSGVATARDAADVVADLWRRQNNELTK